MVKAKKFILQAGETAPQKNPNIIGGDTFYPKRIVNMYCRDGAMYLRPSTRLLAKLTLTAGSRIDTSYIDVVRKWLVVSTITSANKIVTYVIDGLDFAPGKRHIVLNANEKAINSINIGDLVGPRVTYEAFKEASIDKTRNPVTGPGGILMTGSDKLYYIDDTATTTHAAKTFQIFANGKNKPFLKPIAVKLEQQRLMAIGAGADLAADNDADIADSNYLYGSVTYDKVDNFNITTSTFVRDTEVAFRFEFNIAPSESLFGMSVFLGNIVITSSEAIYNLSSRTGQISGVDGVLSEIGGDKVGCKLSDPIKLDSMLIYTSNQGFRQQYAAATVQGQQVYQLYDSESSMYRPMILDFLTPDPIHKGLLGFDKESGIAKFLYWYRLSYPQQGQVLAMTTYYESEYFNCVQTARTPSAIYDILILQDKNDPLSFYVVHETEEYGSRDLIQVWEPQAVISAWDTTSNILTVASFIDLDSANGIKGLWIEARTDQWFYCYRISDTNLEFQYLNDLGPTITGRTGTFKILLDTENIYNQIPTDYKKFFRGTEKEEGLRLDISWSCVDSSMTSQVGSIISQIYGSPSNNPTNQLSFTTTGANELVLLEFSLWQMRPRIEWLGPAVFQGAPVTPTQYIIYTNPQMHEGYDILFCNAPIKQDQTSLDNEYATSKLIAPVNTYNNIMSVEFLNKKKVTVSQNKISDIPAILFISPF